MKFTENDFFELLSVICSKDVATLVRNRLASDPLARHVFHVLLNKVQPRTKTDVYRIKLAVVHHVSETVAPEKQLTVDDVYIFGFFQELQKAGYGKLTIIKLPGHSKFVWTLPVATFIKEVRAVLDGGHSPKPSQAQQPSSPGPKVQVVFPMGDEIVSISLPRSFNQAQAAQLGQYLLRIASQNERGEL